MKFTQCLYKVCDAQKQSNGAGANADDKYRCGAGGINEPAYIKQADDSGKAAVNSVAYTVGCGLDGRVNLLLDDLADSRQENAVANAVENTAGNDHSRGRSQQVKNNHNEGAAGAKKNSCALWNLADKAGKEEEWQLEEAQEEEIYSLVGNISAYTLQYNYLHVHNRGHCKADEKHQADDEHINRGLCEGTDVLKLDAATLAAGNNRGIRLE